MNALAGILTVCITFKIAEPLGLKVAWVSTLMVAVNTLFLLHNRLAVGESLSILFLGPFISRITNARFLALIVPLSILAAQSLTEPKFLKIDIKKLGGIGQKQVMWSAKQHI